MDRIVLGDTIVVSRPATTTRPSAQVHTAGERRAVLLDEARTAAGFAVRQPNLGRTDGLAPVGIELLLLPAPGGPRVAQVVSRFRGAAGRWLILRQIGAGEGDAPPSEIGIPHALRAVRVGDRPAAYFAHPVAAAARPDGAILVAHCLWECDGCLLELQAPHLTAEELALIGAALR